MMTTTTIDKSIEGRRSPKDLSKAVENTEVHKEFFELQGLKFQKEKNALLKYFLVGFQVIIEIAIFQMLINFMKNLKASSLAIL